MIWLAVFLSFVFLDIGWTRWGRAIADKHVARAVLWAMMITMLGAFSAVEYVKDPWLIIPATLGAGVGTWIGMRK